MTGGRCDNNLEMPADFGGGTGWALNLGTPSTSPDGPDYIGILVTVESGASVPDGEYSDGEALATINAGGASFNVGDLVLVLEGGGTRGSFTGRSRPGDEPIRGAFAC